MPVRELLVCFVKIKKQIITAQNMLFCGTEFEKKKGKKKKIVDPQISVLKICLVFLAPTSETGLLRLWYIEGLKGNYLLMDYVRVFFYCLFFVRVET